MKNKLLLLLAVGVSHNSLSAMGAARFIPKLVSAGMVAGATYYGYKSVPEETKKRITDTVKSDLCIGDADVVQHDTAKSQLYASLRVVGYGIAGQIPLAIASTAMMRRGRIPVKAPYGEVSNTHMFNFLVTVVAPLVEEALFTYGAQKLIKKAPEEYRNRLSYIPSVLFGLVHSPVQVIPSIFSNHIRQRYYLKRDLNPVAVESHAIHNGSCVAFIKLISK